MNRARENRFLQFFLIKINKINIFMTAEIKEMNAPLNSTCQNLSIKKLYNPLLSFLLDTEIKRPFLASEHRWRDPAWFSVRCWEKTQDLTPAPVMSG